MASDSAGEEGSKDQGHRNHFRLLEEDGFSWSGREPNTLFQNLGDGTFDEVGNVLGLYLRLDSRGAAAGDLDNDGDLDLVVYNRNNPTVKVYRNDAPGQGNVLQVDLSGAAPNTLAAGAQAIASCGGRRFLRQVELGSGFLSQGPPTLHFGVGACSRVDELEILWPSGLEQRERDLPVNHRIAIAEGEPGFAAEPLRPRNYNRSELAPKAGELSAVRPDLAFTRIGEPGELALSELDRDTAVLNFWATWCTACVIEMPELGELARQFPRVRFVGISLDEGKEAAEVLAFAREHGTSYPQVWGTVGQQAPFASLGGSPPGAVPITAVLHRGTVRAVYVGKIDPAELTELLGNL